MSYLIQSDFKKLIQNINLSQVIGGDFSLLDSAMIDSEETAREYLSAKFLVDNELSSTDQYDPNFSYSPDQRVYLDANLYDPSLLYAINTLTLFNGSVYICNTPIIIPEAFNPGHWTVLGLEFDLFYVPKPKPLFNIATLYTTGTEVYWNGKTYTCQIASLQIDHTIAIQLQYYSNIPQKNIFPDDVNNGIKYWGVGVNASLPTNSLPVGWTKGDNRNRSLVRHCVAIALYIIHFRISPQNIPKHIEKMYMGKEEDRIATRDGCIYPDYCALGWLQSASRGQITTSLPVIQPASGGRIRWGSKIRNQNGY
jgi:hypothetical protein